MGPAVDRVQAFQDGSAYRVQITVTLGPARQRQLVPERTRILERIVDPAQSLGAGISHVLDEPHLFEVPDMP